MSEQKQTEEVEGLDTIFRLMEDPPMEIEIPYNLLYNQQLLKQAWNKLFTAILPTCFVCKELLVWHSPPGQDRVLFHCPICKRTWIKHKDWEEQKKKEGTNKCP